MLQQNINERTFGFFAKLRESIKLINKRFKLKKYHEIFLVDTENIGWKLPKYIPNDCLILMFISNPDVFDRINNIKYDNNVVLIDINLIIKDGQVNKNAMDFCIVTYISYLACLVTNKQKLNILSRDKGYSSAILSLQNLFPHLLIERTPLPLECIFNTDTKVKEIFDKINDELMKKIQKYTSMEQLKRNLQKKEIKIFCLLSYIHPISFKKVEIEFDTYDYGYTVFSYDDKKSHHKKYDDAYRMYEKHINELNKRYSYYKSPEHLQLAYKLKVNQCVENAAIRDANLREHMNKYFGPTDGPLLYNQFTNKKKY